MYIGAAPGLLNTFFCGIINLTELKIKNYFFISLLQLDALNCGGVPTRTTPTLTPTTLKNIEQMFIELQSDPQTHQNEAGFVPPLLQPSTSVNNVSVTPPQQPPSSSTAHGNFLNFFTLYICKKKKYI